MAIVDPFEQIQAAGIVDPFEDSDIVDPLEDAPEKEKTSKSDAFFGGIAKTLYGAGETLGIVDPEDYKAIFEGTKEYEKDRPLISGLGQATGVLGAAGLAAITAPASVPMAGTALAATTGAAMMGGSEYARLGPEGEKTTPLARLQGADLASDVGMVGFAAPAALGTTLGGRVATGTGMNTLLGGGQRAVEHDIIHAERPDLAPEVFDPTAMGVDVLFGAGTGGVVHMASPKGKVSADTPTPTDGSAPKVDESQHVDLGTKEIVTQRKTEFQKQVDYAEYKIKELEKDLQDPRNAKRSPEEAEQYKAAVIEQIVGHQKDITALKQSIDNADAILRGETPAPKAEPTQDMPTGQPPRPEGDAFVRPEETPTGQDVNGGMFDQDTAKTNLDNLIKGREFSLQQLQQEAVEARMEAANGGREFDEAYYMDGIKALKEDLDSIKAERDSLYAPTEEITISPMADNRPISELDLDTVGDRISEVKDGLRDPAEWDALLARRAELENVPVRPKGLVINGGSDRIRGIVTDWVKRLGLDKEDIDFNIGTKDDLLLDTELGNATVRPDGTSEINVVSADTIIRNIENNPKFKEEAHGMNVEQRASLKEALTAAHELGHILLGRLLQNDLFINGKKGVLNTLDGNLGIKKLLDEFEAWKEKTSLEDQRAAGNLFARPSKPDYYRDFPEFFAQRVARELVMGKSSTAGPISKFINTIRSFVKDAIKSLGLSKAFERNIVDTFITDLIKANKESVAQFGKNIFEMQATSTSLYDAWMWHARTLYATPKADGTVGAGPNSGNKRAFDFVGPPTIHTIAVRHVENAESVIKAQQSSPDIAPMGTGTLFKHMRGMLNQGLNAFTRNWFGIQQQAQLYSSSPAVRHTADVIMSSLAKQTQRSMELLAGVTDRAAWDKTRKGILLNLQKVKDNLSLAVVAEKSSNADFHEVQKVFEQGIGKYSYEESLAQFGANLTPQQRTLYDTLSKMYANQYRMAEEVAQRLGKKSIIPNMKGWFPAGRKGEFVVNFRIAGLEGIGGRMPDGSALMTDLAYSQSFFSREEAQAFIKHFESQSDEFKGFLQHDGIQIHKDTEMPNTMSEFVAAYKEQSKKLSKELEKARFDLGLGDDIKDDLAWVSGVDKRLLPKWLRDELEGAEGDIQKVLDNRMQHMADMFIARGGALGAHHQLRANILGYAGSEMFKDIGSAGKAFRDANFASVDEYTRLMMKMEIGQKLDLLLNDEGLRGSHPETMAVVSQMRDYALNDVKTPLEMKGLKRFIDKVYTDSYTDKSKVRKFLGADKYRDTHLTDVTLGKMAHVFYLHALMSRPAFWAAQGSQFMWIARSLVKDGAGPVDAMAAAGKGFMTLLHPSKEFLDGVFWQSQNTHTFSPQFINDLNKFHVLDFLKEGSKGKLLVDLATGEKQSTAADTFSRLMSYSMMYEHYKALGYKGEELYVAAGRATDENMVQYGRQYKAPIFQKAGMIGDLLSPLQTFSQAALGNLIADVGGILKAKGGKAKLRASMPFMMTMTITSLMAGVIGAPLVMEYEALRLALNYIAEKIGLEARLPSVIDTVLSGDNEFSNRVLSHGLISASTMAIDEEGFDIGASNRWQPIISGVITGEKTFLEAMPTINFALQEAGYAIDLTSHVLGLKTMSEAERRTAAMGVTPGMYKGLTNLLYDDGSGAVPTQKGDAFVENTGAEKASKFLGTSTINASTARLRERRTKEEAMRKADKVNKKYELMADALQRGDTDRVREIAVDLGTNYEQSGQQMQSRMKAEMFRRKTPSGMRQFVGKGGSMSTKQKLDYQRWQDTYEDSPFEEDNYE